MNFENQSVFGQRFGGMLLTDGAFGCVRKHAVVIVSATVDSLPETAGMSCIELSPACFFLL